MWCVEKIIIAYDRSWKGSFEWLCRGKISTVGVGGTRVIRFNHVCATGVYPDNHGAEELCGHEELIVLTDAMNGADEAAAGFIECNSCPSHGTIPEITRLVMDRRRVSHAGGHWIHDEQRYSVQGELSEMGGAWPYKPYVCSCAKEAGVEAMGDIGTGDALVMVRRMKTSGEFCGFGKTGPLEGTVRSSVSGVNQL